MLSYKDTDTALEETEKEYCFLRRNLSSFKVLKFDLKSRETRCEGGRLNPRECLYGWKSEKNYARRAYQREILNKP